MTPGVRVGHLGTIEFYSRASRRERRGVQGPWQTRLRHRMGDNLPLQLDQASTAALGDALDDAIATALERFATEHPQWDRSAIQLAAHFHLWRSSEQLFVAATQKAPRNGHGTEAA